MNFCCFAILNTYSSWVAAPKESGLVFLWSNTIHSVLDHPLIIERRGLLHKTTFNKYFCFRPVIPESCNDFILCISYISYISCKGYNSCKCCISYYSCTGCKGCIVILNSRTFFRFPDNSQKEAKTKKQDEAVQGTKYISNFFIVSTISLYIVQSCI